MALRQDAALAVGQPQQLAGRRVPAPDDGCWLRDAYVYRSVADQLNCRGHQ
jgi:hypothetical protein